MSNYRYTYLRTEPEHPDHRGFPLACIAMDFDSTLNKAYVGVSVVHPKDAKSGFSKRLARGIAKGRAELTPFVVSIVSQRTKPSTHDILHSVLIALKGNNTLPIRVHKAIEAWLLKAQAKEVAQTANILTGLGSPQSIITASIKQVKAKQIKSPISYSGNLLPPITPKVPAIGSFLTPPPKPTMLMGF